MKKHNVLLLFCLTLLPFSIFSIIFESDNIQDLKRYISDNSIVIFDIDDTIVKTPQELGSDAWFEYMVKQQVDQGSTFNQAVEIVFPLFFLVHLSISLEALNNNAISFITEIQNNNIPVIALTSRSIPLANRTKEELKRLDLHFYNNNFEQQNIHLSVTHQGLYSEGIIFCANNNKGKMLLQFLEAIHYFPKTIIFVDDKMSHLIHVGKEIENNNIEFVGMRYTGSDERKETFDGKKADQQLITLKKNLGLFPL